MSKRLVGRRAEKLAAMGKTILARLQADPRLTEAAGSMKTTQSVLEAKVAALDAARTAEQLTHARRDEEQRLLAAEVREFGFIVLSVNGNHHDADPYLLYFPDGYGDAMQLTSDALADFVRLLLTKLATETNPKILPRKEPIEEALNRFVTEEAAAAAAFGPQIVPGPAPPQGEIEEEAAYSDGIIARRRVPRTRRRTASFA